MKRRARTTDLPALALAALAFVLSAAAYQSPARAGEVASVTEIFRAETSEQRLPRRWEGVLVVPRDMDQETFLRVSYWSTAEHRANRGRVSVAFEVRRDLDGDGTTDAVEVSKTAGRIRSHAFEKTIGPLAPLRAGDLVLFDARPTNAARPEVGHRAVVEIALLDSPESCPDLDFSAETISSPVTLLRSPFPRYTEEARRAGITGTVTLEGHLGCDGRVSRIRVVKSLPMGLDEESVETLSQWRWAPAKADGKPVLVFFTLTVSFQLQVPAAQLGGAIKPSVTVDGRLGTDPGSR